MELLKELCIRIVLTAFLYMVLTLPHITLILFNHGFKYTDKHILLCAFEAILLTVIFRYKKH